MSVAGWFELQGSQTGSFIAPGFSGAAVFDETWRRIFGMVIALDGPTGTRTAYLQSTQNIWKACPSLARPYRGLRAFEEEDAAFLFGREAFVSEMAEKAQRHALLGVTAAPANVTPARYLTDVDEAEWIAGCGEALGAICAQLRQEFHRSPSRMSSAALSSSDRAKGRAVATARARTQRAACCDRSRM